MYVSIGQWTLFVRWDSCNRPSAPAPFPTDSADAWQHPPSIPKKGDPGLRSKKYLMKTKAFYQDPRGLTYTYVHGKNKMLLAGSAAPAAGLNKVMQNSRLASDGEWVQKPSGLWAKEQKQSVDRSWMLYT